MARPTLCVKSWAYEGILCSFLPTDSLYAHPEGKFLFETLCLYVFKLLVQPQNFLVLVRCFLIVLSLYILGIGTVLRAFNNGVFPVGQSRATIDNVQVVDAGQYSCDIEAANRQQQSINFNIKVYSKCMNFFACCI